MDKLVTWIKNLDLGSKISYGVLVLSVIICMLILSARMNTNSKVANIPNSVTPTTVKTTIVPTKKVNSDFDTKTVASNVTPSGSVSVTPKVTTGVSSQIITPSKSLVPTVTLIPTLTPSPTPTLIPTLTPIPTATLIPTITPTFSPTSTPADTPTPTPTIAILSKITLSANDVELYPGEKQQITVYFEPSNAADKNLTWTYDGNVVDITADGLITAKNEGRTNVVVTGSNGKSTLLKVTVSSSGSFTPTSIPTAIPTKATISLTPTPKLKLTATPTSNQSGSVTGITVNPTSISIDEGARQKLTFNVIPSNAKNPGLTWKYDGYIMSMDTSGLITGKNAGKTVIVFRTSNGITKSVSVTVKPKPTNTPTPTRKPTPTPTIRINSMKLDSSKGSLVCNQTSKVVGTDQCSSENSKLSLNSHCSSRTVCANGCGMVSTSIILQAHNPKNTPKCLLTPSMGCEGDFFTHGGVCPISWTSMSNTLIANLGKGALYNNGKKFSCDKKVVSKMLCSGWVLIVHIRRSDGTGHWTVAAATTSTGDIVMADTSSDKKFSYWSNMMDEGYRRAWPTYCLAIEASSI